MPPRKRAFEDFDPNKSDSDDSDFDLSAVRSKPARPQKRQKVKTSRKKRKAGYATDGSDDISEGDTEEDSASYSEDEASDDPPEVDPRTGRPVRKAAKQTATYEESDESDIDSDQEAPKPKKALKSSPRRPRLIVTLKTPKKKASAIKTVAGTRARQQAEGEAGEERPRRSSRITRDGNEDLVALTNSGRHVIEVDKAQDEESEEDSEHQGVSVIAEGIEEDEPSDKMHDVVNESDPEEMGQERTADAATEKDPDPIQDENGADATAADPGPSAGGDNADDDDDDDDDVVGRMRRRKRSAVERSSDNEDAGAAADDNDRDEDGQPKRKRLTRSRKRGVDDTSDFEPPAEDDAADDASSSEAERSPEKNVANEESSDEDTGRKSRGRSRRRPTTVERDSDEADELAEELQELQRDGRTRRTRRKEMSPEDRPTRKRKPVDYRILRPDLNLNIEDEVAPAASTPSRRGRGAAGPWQRSLFSTYGPFGGAGGPAPVFGGLSGAMAAGGADSDSSDDEAAARPRPGVGGAVGMTPTSAAPAGFGMFPGAAATGGGGGGGGGDPLQSNLGKIKDKQALTDADPLGVDQNVQFDGVGGLQGHIEQLKEMVMLPLLYPEIFQKFKVTPPRGVLFHGPPGTGKTLMARALASSVSSQGKKVTFYMRKGADALSKWVGEAERGLRLLFEEARKNQPSIIFFDEIDGLAPVRSSKQEQIHASIVSTLLALMDGMDGRGQVVVIGATNRPDSVDPALRRPGRFDREFYFPLPNKEARRTILDIHTKGWVPAVPASLKNELAELTKGYGGADLRSLCTEAALNAVQRRYPQIYSSNEKLQIDPDTIEVTAKDFMISVEKIVPSSLRSASSSYPPLPKSVVPLLQKTLDEIAGLVRDVMPQEKKRTALDEAQYEDLGGDMRTEVMRKEFQRNRTFRPRLVIRGPAGMGQQYVADALLHHLDGIHIAPFDLSRILSDSTQSIEASLFQLFSEAKQHKPCIIYLSNIEEWHSAVGDAGVATLQGLLKSLVPTDPVLLLGTSDSADDSSDPEDPQLIRRLFGFSKRNQFTLRKPSREARAGYFEPLAEYIDASPERFPDPSTRKMRVLEELPVAPSEAPKTKKELSKAEARALKKRDRQTLNILKLRIQPIMDQIKLKFKKFRVGVIDESAIRYLYEEEEQAAAGVATEGAPDQLLAAPFRPYEKANDDHGEPGLLEVQSNKFYYNLEIITIEKRLSNGYYKRPKDFLGDIKKLTKDAKTLGDQERLLKANELQANVEVDIGNIELEMPALADECEAVYLREKAREKEMIEKAKKAAQAEGVPFSSITTNIPPDQPTQTEETGQPDEAGPITLGQPHDSTAEAIRKSPPPQPQQVSGSSGLTNGTSDLDNLSGNHTEKNNASMKSNGEDVHMTNSEDYHTTSRETQNSSFGHSAQARPATMHTGAPSSVQQRMSLPGSLSQKSAITPMAEGTDPQMYENSASTTSSDKRMTGSSGPIGGQSSGEREPTNAGQRSIREEGRADISVLIGHAPSNSQLPSTQEASPQSQTSVQTSSQSQPATQPHSQTPTPTIPAFPKTQTSPIHSLLNASPQNSQLIVNTALSKKFVEDLVNMTSPCSIEQLEQIYCGLMSEIWKSRGSWNRVSIINDLRDFLRDLVDDIGISQGFGPGSDELANSQYNSL